VHARGTVPLTSPPSGYYDGATDLYEYGWGQNFHFARYYPGEAFYQAIARHEHYLAFAMHLKPGMRVLDVGCGVGGPAREIARFAGVEIVGLNNNAYQVERANKYTRKAGLENQVSCEWLARGCGCDPRSDAARQSSRATS
jgi:sterol 24-C-methyltransferase